jgi:hypothetical protein
MRFELTTPTLAKRDSRVFLKSETCRYIRDFFFMFNSMMCFCVQLRSFVFLIDFGGAALLCAPIPPL